MKKRIKHSVARDLFKWFIALAIEHEAMTMHISLPLLYPVPRSEKHEQFLLHYYQIIGISTYSLLMMTSERASCAVGWAANIRAELSREGPPKCFFSTLLEEGPRSRRREGKRNKHNFEISQSDSKMMLSCLRAEFVQQQMQNDIHAENSNANTVR